MTLEADMYWSKVSTKIFPNDVSLFTYTREVSVDQIT